MQSKPIINQEYSRQQVHDLFSPNTKFTKSTGSWGLRGIIKIIKNKNDYIFIVSYWQKQANHNFDETITKDGILFWQSQPSQDFESNDIKNFINHNEKINNIHLFLRENTNHKKYKYLGLLKYLSHEKDKIKPVYFRWILLDFNKTSFYNLFTPVLKNQKSISFKNKLILINDLELSKKKPKEQNLLKAGFVPFDELYKENEILGALGEELVVIYEKQKLLEIGRFDLAEKVSMTRDFLGNSAKYDIRSYNKDGSLKYIEVKTTTKDQSYPFYISEGEVMFSEKFDKDYYLYRIFNFDVKENFGNFFIIKGKINRKNIAPEKYKYVFNGEKNE